MFCSHGQAVAVLKGDSKVTGVITFTQEKEGGPVTVSGEVSALICWPG